MKIVYYINKLLTFIAILLGTYVYTTYFGFLGLGNVEMEKFLVIPFIIVPVLLFTFIINKILNRRIHLKKNELMFPIYAILVFMIPLFLDSSLSYFIGFDIQSIVMIIANVLGIVFIIWFMVISFKSFKYGI